MGGILSFLKKKTKKSQSGVTPAPAPPADPTPKDESPLPPAPAPAPAPVPELAPVLPPVDVADGWKKGTFEGLTYNYRSIKPSTPDKVTFLLLHGFPNGPSNYKYFIPEITSRGHGVIMPEMLGYGETDKPTNVEAYAFKPLCSQLAAILDAEGVAKVVGLGHDFGAPLIARFSQFYPERVLGIVLGGAPYNPPSPTALNVEAVLAAVAPLLGYENIGYFKFFPAEHAPAEIEDHLESFVSIMFGPPGEWKERVCASGGLESSLKENHISKVEPWMSQEDKEELIEYLRKTGLTGPCMWFRAAVSPVNTGDHGVIDPRVKHPYLYISPAHDPSYPLPMAARQNPLCDDITTKTIQTGHWIFEQDPKGSAQLVLEWGAEKGLF
ncbi:alpha/beta-hydrolase [Clavulina sp. PMI_390]|nr:alpha/beta-hydrolase [Clavulina sp. PMI_390]